jgi:hypothetical protein
VGNCIVPEISTVMASLEEDEDRDLAGKLHLPLQTLQTTRNIR